MLYLNNTATSFPKPQGVIDAVNELLVNPPCHSNRSGLEREMEDIDYSCRVKLAELFNAEDPNRIVFSSGSTESLNLAIWGLQLNGAHVVSTGIEHNSVIRPLKTLEKKGRIELTFVDCDEKSYVSPESIEAAIKDNTELIVVNHSSNVTGTILDIEKIAKIAHAHNAKILIDASQSAGNIKIDVKNWDIDLLAFTGHKSLYGMPGTGGLYIKKGIEIEPLIVGGTGILSEILYQPEGMPIYYEAGTPNLPGIASLRAGVEFVLKTGIDTIREHKVKLVKRAIEELENYTGVSVYYHPEFNSFTNFCFNVEGFVPEEVGYMLEESYDIHVRSGLHCAPLVLGPLGVDPWGTVRASPSYFTSDEDMQKFINAVKEIADMGQQKINNGK